jgi:hypothetical protein
MIVVSAILALAIASGAFLQSQAVSISLHQSIASQILFAFSI